MRKLTILFFVFLLFYSISFAQQDIYLMGGATIPQKPVLFGDLWKVGINASAGLGWSVWQYASANFMIDMNTLPFNKSGKTSTIKENVDFCDSAGAVYSGNWYTLATVGVNVKLFPIPFEEATIAVPYIIGGIGYMISGTSDVGVTYGSKFARIKGFTESAFVITVGAGVDIPMATGLGIFIEGKYKQDLRKSDYTAYIPVSIGVRIAN